MAHSRLINSTTYIHGHKQVQCTRTHVHMCIPHRSSKQQDTCDTGTTHDPQCNRSTLRYHDCGIMTAVSWPWLTVVTKIRIIQDSILSFFKGQKVPNIIHHTHGSDSRRNKGRSFVSTHAVCEWQQYSRISLRAIISSHSSYLLSMLGSCCPHTCLYTALCGYFLRSAHSTASTHTCQL